MQQWATEAGGLNIHTVRTCYRSGLSICFFTPLSCFPADPNWPVTSLALVIESDRCHRPVSPTFSQLLLFIDCVFAIDEEAAELVQDAVRRHLPVEGVGAVEVPQQLLLLAAGQRGHLDGVSHLWTGDSVNTTSHQLPVFIVAGSKVSITDCLVSLHLYSPHIFKEQWCLHTVKHHCQKMGVVVVLKTFIPLNHCSLCSATLICQLQALCRWQWVSTKRWQC